MFHKLCVVMAIAGLSGVAFGVEKLPQIVTSEVFYDSSEVEHMGTESERMVAQDFYAEPMPVRNAPAWPLAGSDADVTVACGEAGCSNNSGLVIESNILTQGAGWSGGPNIINGIQVPAGFDNECENNAEMPLLNREMLEDDGGSVLAVSRSPRKKCNKRADSYAVFAERAGFATEKTCNKNMKKAVVGAEPESEIAVTESVTETASESVNEYTDEEAPAVVRDQVRSWVVASGQTLRQVLQAWCDKEGWDLVWTTDREYPIEASAVFKGRFVDVASALVRNFERATPIPYAKFYKGNRVIVVSTNEE